MTSLGPKNTADVERTSSHGTARSLYSSCLSSVSTRTKLLGTGHNPSNALKNCTLSLPARLHSARTVAYCLAASVLIGEKRPSAECATLPFTSTTNNER